MAYFLSSLLAGNSASHFSISLALQRTDFLPTLMERGKRPSFMPVYIVDRDTPAMELTSLTVSSRSPLSNIAIIDASPSFVFHCDMLNWNAAKDFFLG